MDESDLFELMHRRVREEFDRIEAKHPDLLSTIDVDGKQYIRTDSALELISRIYPALRRAEDVSGGGIH